MFQRHYTPARFTKDTYNMNPACVSYTHRVGAPFFQNSEDFLVVPSAGCAYCPDTSRRTDRTLEEEKEYCAATCAQDKTFHPCDASCTCLKFRQKHFMCNSCWQDWNQKNRNADLRQFRNHCVQCQILVDQEAIDLTHSPEAGSSSRQDAAIANSHSYRPASPKPHHYYLRLNKQRNDFSHDSGETSSSRDQPRQAQAQQRVASVAHNIPAASASQAFANADTYEPTSKKTHQHNLRLCRPQPDFHDEDDFDHDEQGQSQKRSSAQRAGGAAGSAANNDTNLQADAAAVGSQKEISSGSEKRASETNAGGKAQARTRQPTRDKGKQKQYSDAAGSGKEPYEPARSSSLGYDDTQRGSEKRASETNAGGKAQARTKQPTQDKGKQKQYSDAAGSGKEAYEPEKSSSLGYDDTQLAEMWEKTKAKFDGRKYGTIEEAVDDINTKTSMHKTIVQRSAFVESRSEYKEFGLFVRPKYRVNIADIVGILCTNQNSSDKEPSGQMSYLMPGKQYCKFENSDQLHMQGCYANTCMGAGDPPINAIFKHIRLSIANAMVTLVVLVALKPIASKQEIFVDYGNIFGKTHNCAKKRTES